MKIAVISDVHSNREALQAVLDRIGEESPDETWFLGDAVGYGPEPNECLEILRGACAVLLMGNHDAAAVGLTDVSEFNLWARAAVEYTTRTLTPSNRAFLEGLPYDAGRRGAFLVHSSPFEPRRWHYVMTVRDAHLAFEHFTEGLCLIGHSHYPVVMRRDREGTVSSQPFGTLRLGEEARCIVNVGSVGQPRDGDPRAAFAVLDDDAGKIRLERVEYDIAAVQGKMAEQGLPDYLIRRLSRGM